MSVRPNWIPSRTITITVAAHNSGLVRMVRILGPSGESEMVPKNRDDWHKMTSWVADVVSGELAVALGEIDEMCGG